MRATIWTVIFAAGAAVARGIEPADKDLISEARAVLNYLESVYGKQCLSAVHGTDNAGFVFETSGRLPAIDSFDLTGWNSPTWGKTYTPVVERSIADAKEWWDRGGIVAMQFHWKNPSKPDGSAWVGKHGSGPPSGPFDMAAATKKGTAANKQFFDDLAKHADYLQKLSDAHVPVLWRPFHEIDGGWFWWTDQETPENTAQMYRLMFDYLVKERKFHNLIWVYNPGVAAGGYKKMLREKKSEGSLAEEIAFRKRYYPGAELVDIAGIDIYPNKSEGYAEPMNDTFPKAFEIMKQVAPGKILAMCESSFVINPELMQKNGPKWLYSLQWFEGDPGYTRTTYNHDFLTTLDELPKLNPGPIIPFVRLVAPIDGQDFPAGNVELKADTESRNDDIAQVEFLDLATPWKNWWMMKPSEKREAFAGAIVIGVAKEKPFSFVWKNPPAGLHNIAARITNKKGVAEFSNIARINVGIENLARKGKITASSKADEAQKTEDGNLFTSWNGDKNGDQWLAVDLGEEKSVGAVSVAWWKAYAKAYQIQISNDGATWKDVHAAEKGYEFLGNTDVIRFAPVKTRHVRLLCTKTGTNWGGYTVYEFGIYPSLPK